MKTDPTIERIRQIRHHISEECEHDPQKLLEYYLKYQQQYADRLVSFPTLKRYKISPPEEYMKRLADCH
jgi:hypothetical protein